MSLRRKLYRLLHEDEACQEQFVTICESPPRFNAHYNQFQEALGTREDLWASVCALAGDLLPDTVYGRHCREYAEELRDEVLRRALPRLAHISGAQADEVNRSYAEDDLETFRDVLWGVCERKAA